MNGKDLLVALLMAAPTFALIVAVLLGLLLMEPRTAAPEVRPAPAKYAKAAETARCDASQSRERACY